MSEGINQCQKFLSSKLGEEFRFKLNYFLKEKVFLVLFCFYFMEKFYTNIMAKN